MCCLGAGPQKMSAKKSFKPTPGDVVVHCWRNGGSLIAHLQTSGAEVPGSNDPGALQDH